MKEVVNRKENTSRPAESSPESVAPSQLKAAPPFQLFAGSEKPAQLWSAMDGAASASAAAASVLSSEEESEEKDEGQSEVAAPTRRQRKGNSD
jgi:hypothetical protein